MQSRNSLNGKHLIWIILIVAFAIRFLGVWWGYPVLVHGDEKGEIVTGAFEILDFRSSGGVAPVTHNGPLLKYLLALVFGIWGLFGSVFSSIDSIVALWKSTSIDTIVARIIVGVLAGTLSVWIVYLAGRRFGGQITGLAAAFFMAVAFKLVEFSHIATSDVSAALFVILVLYFALRFMDTGRSGDLRWSAILCAAAVATKLSTAPAVAIPITAVVLRQNAEMKDRLTWFITLMLSGLAALILFHLPYVTRPAEFIRQVTTTLLVQTFYFKKGFFWFFRPDIYPANQAPTAGIGMTLLIVSLTGLLLNLFSPGRKKWVVLAFPVVFYLIIGNSQVKLTRYFLPMVPFLCLWGGYFVARFSKVLPARLTSGYRSALTVLITIVLAWPNVIHSAIFSLQCADGNSFIEFDHKIHDIIPDRANWAALYYTPLIQPPPGILHDLFSAKESKDLHMQESARRVREKMPLLGNLVEDTVSASSNECSFLDTPLDSLRSHFHLTYIVINGTVVESWYETPVKFLRYPQDLSTLRNTIRDLQTKWEMVYKTIPRYHQTWGESSGGRPPAMYLYRYPGNDP